MADYLLIPLLVLGHVMPLAVGLVTAATLLHTERGHWITYGIGVTAWMGSVCFGVGIDIYAYSLHPAWWNGESGGMGFADVVAGILAFVVAVWVTILVVPD